MIDLNRIQHEQWIWARKNFGPSKPHQPLLGLIEEVGELAHAHLKTEQDIRKGEDLEAKRRDSIGDICVYLLEYCTCFQISLEETISEVWNQVKMRDWESNPETGESNGTH